MAVDTTAFFVSLAINTGICAACFIVFSLLRTAQLTRKYYAPKRYADDVKHRPKKLPLGYLGWCLPILRYPEDELIKVAGLDAAVFIRILRFGLKLMLYLSVWCCVIVLPVNITDNYVDELLRKNKNVKSSEKVEYSNVDRIYMTNVKPKSSRLWAHSISVYVVTYIILKLLWDLNQDLSRLRINFLATVPKGGPSHTVLVTDIPGIRAGTILDTICRLMNTSILRFAPKRFKDRVNELIEMTYGATTGSFKSLTKTMQKAISKDKDLANGDQTDEIVVGNDVLFPQEAALQVLRTGANSQVLVEQEFKAAYGEDVVSVNPVYNQRDLEPLMAQYEKTKMLLEDLLDHYESRIRRRKPVVPKMVRVIGPMLGAWGMERYGMKPVKVDALGFYPARLDELRRLIREAEPVARADFYPTSFVTFSTRYTHAVASSGLHSHDEATWRIQEAPGQDEILWSNLRMRSWERNLRNLAMWALFVAMIVFFSVVCTFLQGFVNIKQLESIAFIKAIISISFVRSIIMGILPGLVLKIFLILLPTILAIMNRFAGMVSLSQVDFGVVEKFFIFQLCTVFLASTVAGTALNQMKAIIADPSQIWGVVQKIANGIPQQATFFMTWVMLNGLTSKPIAFLRVVGLVIFWLLSKLAATERAKTRLWANQEQMMGIATTDHVMACLFGIVFCIQAPLITPVCLYYFFVNLLIEKYQTLYVFSRPYESGGRLWAKIYRQIMTAVYIFQVVMILQLGLKGFYFTPLLFPCFFITISYDRACTSLFRRPWVLLSMRAAAELDRLDEQADGHAGLNEEEREAVADTYLSPVFKIDDKEHADIIAEAAEVQRRISGLPDDPELGGVPYPPLEEDERPPSRRSSISVAAALPPSTVQQTSPQPLLPRSRTTDRV